MTKRTKEIRAALKKRTVPELTVIGKELGAQKLPRKRALLIDEILKVGEAKVSRHLGLTTIDRVLNWTMKHRVQASLVLISLLLGLIGVVGVIYTVVGYYEEDPEVAKILDHSAAIHTQLVEEQINSTDFWMDFQAERTKVAWNAQYSPDLLSAVDHLDGLCDNYRTDHDNLTARQAKIVSVADAMSAFAHGDFNKVASLISDETAQHLIDDGTIPRTTAVQANTILGWSLNAQGKWKGSLRCFERVIAVSPNEPNANYWAAQASTHLGKWKSAEKRYSCVISQFSPIVKAHPEDHTRRNLLALAFLGRAKANSEQSQYEAADRDGDAAITHLDHVWRKSEHPDAGVNLAVAYGSKGIRLSNQRLYDDGFQYFNKCITILKNIDRPTARLAEGLFLYHRGTAYLNAGRFATAADDFNDCLARISGAIDDGHDWLKPTLDIAAYAAGAALVSLAKKSADTGNLEAAIGYNSNAENHMRALCNRNNSPIFRRHYLVIVAQRVDLLEKGKRK